MVHLSKSMAVRGLQITDHARTCSRSNPLGSHGSRMWQLIGPGGQSYDSFLRVIAATFDTRWVFQNEGAVLPFEQPAAYRARKSLDRLTSAMIIDYSREVGVDLAPEGYGSEGSVVELDHPHPPSAWRSFEEAAREPGLSTS